MYKHTKKKERKIMVSLAELIGMYSWAWVLVLIAGILVAAIGVWLMYEWHPYASITLVGIAVLLIALSFGGKYIRDSKEAIISATNKYIAELAMKGYTSESLQFIEYGEGEEFGNNYGRALEVYEIAVGLAEAGLDEAGLDEAELAEAGLAEAGWTEEEWKKEITKQMFGH
jgi:hypothetical protein